MAIVKVTDSDFDSKIESGVKLVDFDLVLEFVDYFEFLEFLLMID